MRRDFFRLVAACAATCLFELTLAACHSPPADNGDAGDAGGDTAIPQGGPGEPCFPGATCNPGLFCTTTGCLVETLDGAIDTGTTGILDSGTVDSGASNATDSSIDTDTSVPVDSGAS